MPCHSKGAGGVLVSPNNTQGEWGLKYGKKVKGIIWMATKRIENFNVIIINMKSTLILTAEIWPPVSLRIKEEVRMLWNQVFSHPQMFT